MQKNLNVFPIFCSDGRKNYFYRKDEKEKVNMFSRKEKIIAAIIALAILLVGFGTGYLIGSRKTDVTEKSQQGNQQEAQQTTTIPQNQTPEENTSSAPELPTKAEEETTNNQIFEENKEMVEEWVKSGQLLHVQGGNIYKDRHKNRTVNGSRRVYESAKCYVTISQEQNDEDIANGLVKVIWEVEENDQISTYDRWVEIAHCELAPNGSIEQYEWFAGL